MVVKSTRIKNTPEGYLLENNKRKFASLQECVECLPKSKFFTALPSQLFTSQLEERENGRLSSLSFAVFCSPLPSVAPSLSLTLSLSLPPCIYSLFVPPFLVLRLFLNALTHTSSSPVPFFSLPPPQPMRVKTERSMPTIWS